MTDIIIFTAFLAFALFLVAGSYRRYAAIAGWSCIVLNMVSELPALFTEANFIYPLLTLLSVPFLAITVLHLWREDPAANRLTTTVAVITIIFVPFAVLPVLRDGLIAITVSLAFPLITALGHHPALYSWDVIVENGFYNQIILACTGILAIALMFGVIAGLGEASLRQRISALLLVVPAIFILNLLRVSVLFIAVSDRWFADLPDPTGTGDANFFWAHNVIAEGLSLGFLVLLILGLCRVLPGLRLFILETIEIYSGDIREVVRRISLL